MFYDTPRANRLHIGFYGRRNVGKSSLVNLATGQDTALVSEYAGTTTDPVIKSMELFPLGPVAVIDTAGFDDEGALGKLRISRTKDMLDRTDLALLIVASDMCGDLSYEKKWLEVFRAASVRTTGILNKKNIGGKTADALSAHLKNELGIEFAAVDALNIADRAELLSAIVENAPSDFEAPTLVGDLFDPGDSILLIAPQDIQAPKGRLILPQVQVLRDILDNGGIPTIVTADMMKPALAKAKDLPALVITDSQMFSEVNAVIPLEVPLTSFSIIMARSKGDIATFLRGAKAIDKLTEKDKVLIAEACTHAPLEEDIGRDKIPRLLRKKVGTGLKIDIATGMDFPSNLREYALVIHCGGCMFTRKQLMSRLIKADAANVPITNYGVALAALKGILDRVAILSQAGLSHKAI